jgi:hypothetical protein
MMIRFTGKTSRFPRISCYLNSFASSGILDHLFGGFDGAAVGVENQTAVFARDNRERLFG